MFSLLVLAQFIYKWFALVQNIGSLNMSPATIHFNTLPMILLFPLGLPIFHIHEKCDVNLASIYISNQVSSIKCHIDGMST